MKQQTLGAIATRRRRISQRDAALAESTIPVRRVREHGATTYIADVLVRRPAPSSPSNRADEKPPALEPTLDDKAFEHVLAVIRQQALLIEQHPKTYASMGEEGRRNRNVFIAECKFWTGEQGSVETIDQLFGYTGWRDTKLDILMFVRAKG